MSVRLRGFTLESFPKGDVTQWFGENPHLYRRWGLAYHNGIDIVGPHGMPIPCVEAGKVVQVKLDPTGYGKHIIVMTDTGRLWVYGHLSNIYVTEGEMVRLDQIIGTMGNTGFVVSGGTEFWGGNNPDDKGTHLHLGVREYVLDKKGWRYNKHMPLIRILNYENGVKGAIDPLPLLRPDAPPRPLTEPERAEVERKLSIAKTLLAKLKELLALIKK